MMKKLALAFVAVFSLAGCVENGSVKNIDATLGAATDLVRAVTLSDEQAKSLAYKHHANQTRRTKLQQKARNIIRV